MHCRVRYSLDSDLKIRSSQVCGSKDFEAMKSEGRKVGYLAQISIPLPLKSPIAGVHYNDFASNNRLDELSLKASKVEIFREQRVVAFLSPSKIFETLNFSTETVLV